MIKLLNDIFDYCSAIAPFALIISAIFGFGMAIGIAVTYPDNTTISYAQLTEAQSKCKNNGNQFDITYDYAKKQLNVECSNEATFFDIQGEESTENK